MVARIALRPLIRVLTGWRKDQIGESLRLLLKDRLFGGRMPTKGDPFPPILFQMATGYWLSQAIYVGAKLGIADLLENGPQSSIALAAATQSDARSLFRVLRALASAGILLQVEEDTFALDRIGYALRSNVIGSLRATVITIGEIHYHACGELLHSVRTGSPAFNRVFGANLFEYLQQNPEAGVTFNQGMTDLASLLVNAVLLAYDFSGITSIVDVGGGEGEFLLSILELHPEMSGIVFDLPGGPCSTESSSDGAERCSHVAGNFFDSVPEGAEAYMLCGVVHDWSDESAVMILRNCRKAMPKNGRVLIVETIVPETNSPSFSKLLDINMMVMTTGRERTRSEFHTLIEAADLRITRVIPTLAPQSIIESTPRTRTDR
jgi:O-methyltransferase/methyltransferase family protein